MWDPYSRSHFWGRVQYVASSYKNVDDAYAVFYLSVCVNEDSSLVMFNKFKG